AQSVIPSVELKVSPFEAGMPELIQQIAACCLQFALGSKIPPGKEKPMAARWQLSIALLLVSMRVSATADAREVYLNGVKLDSSVVRKAGTFTACEGRFEQEDDSC